MDPNLPPGLSPPKSDPNSPSVLFLRGCLVLVFVVLPVAGLAFAVWLFFTPTASENAAEAAYANAPACPASGPARDCIKVERAVLVSLAQIPGRCGGHYDRLGLQLGDGIHQAEIKFDCFGPYPFYSLIGGQVRVREYGGLITTVYAADGTAYETIDSPGNSSWRRGIAAVMVVILGAWVLVLVAFVIWNKFTSRPRASLPKATC
jgi:hypothetical protein